MQRQDRAIILTTRNHGEHDLVVSTFSLGYGRLDGLVKAGRKRAAATLQPGNTGTVTHWRRLDGQLGRLTFDPAFSPATYVFDRPARLQTLRYVGELLARLLMVDITQPKLFDRTCLFLEALAGPKPLWPNLAHWEVDVLHAVGFGLQLDRKDAVTDGPADKTPLLYVSPKTGRAVSGHMGAPYKGRLLLLPALFGGEGGGFLDVFALTGHFLHHALMEHGIKDLPQSRTTLLDMGRQSGFDD